MRSPATLPAGAAEILQLFSGRRRGRRSACQFDITCRGRFRSYPGQALNVSRVGALVELGHRRFRDRGAQGLLAVAGRLYAAFPRGMVLTFTEHSLTVRASVVRVTQDPTTGQMLLGCAFQRALTSAECTQLSVSADDGDVSDEA